MPPNQSPPSSAVVTRLGGGVVAAARLCVIVPAVFILVYFLLAVVSPRSFVHFWVWTERAVVSAGILGVFWIFIRHPWHSRRPEGLTHALLVSVALLLPALVTGFWPAVIGAFVTPVLVAGSALVERFRHA
ncbi:ABC-type multidrug transport system permease subunit [Streptomyces aurantiacus]|uniref:hypothetical protein n=1 Tax=Streptomyces aurantiacus TaxID=47760 RepID=UPI002792646D|nr:hypothetical protein [Streptomyces aurantiacus]MDQ0776580.1 ABC-type multidrug transport system permease subunit [Streptomyces aurantiacus]